MRLAFLYRGEDNAMWFTIGFITAFAVVVILSFIGMAADEWKKFKEYKQQKQNQLTNEVVDADFVERPYTRLNTSQALVRRSTSLTTNRNTDLTRR